MKHILLLSSLIFSMMIPVYAEKQQKSTDSPLQHIASTDQKTALTAQIVTINNQNIAYYESVGTGQTIFLVHGNSASGRAYQHQLQSELGQTYRLIAIDLPGHGSSDAAIDPVTTYSLPGYAKIVIAVADALNATDAIFVGWSLGGHILLEAVNQLAKARGIVIFGTPPIANNPPDLAKAFLPHPALRFGFTAELRQQEMLAYLQTFFSKSTTEVPELFLESIALTDGRARINLKNSLTPTGYQNEIDIVKNMTIPLMVIHGKAEQLVNANYIATLSMPTLWRGEIQFIADAGHAPQWEKPHMFNKLLRDFITDVIHK